MTVNLMHQYILEEKEVLLHLLENRKKIVGSVIPSVDKEVRNVYIIGSGTSYHAAVAAKPLIEEVTNWEVHPTYPSHFMQEKISDSKNNLVLGISQGGSSLSTINGIKRAQKMNIPTVGISEYKDSNLADISDYYLPIEVGDQEKAGAKTKGYVASILTLMLFSLEFSEYNQLLSDEKYINYLARMKKTFEKLDEIVHASEEWVYQIKDELTNAREIMVIGYGSHYATVLEGALKLLETVRVPVIGYEMEEYMHGVYNCVSEDSNFIFLASEHENRERLLALEEFLSKVTNHCYLIGSEKTNASQKDLIISRDEDSIFSVFEYIIPLQLLSAVLANEKGIDPAVSKFQNFHQLMKSKS
ncbi:phosphosugar isomerase [Oceanobacillus oncorhynchi subsp. incaldanensis]|uniref:SIS domain-containing protein n=1 Tax=Oceanobacillus oncorhynchi TaxID=545501 RepID=UPI001B0A0AD3|nr:SIS domain-containing protein [Oceanobacillus oncorhynchi]GIO19583.1 phosphosugar isomerase [Oceanobacillus oncorhynchi subsp. incaldanensis]